MDVPAPFAGQVRDLKVKVGDRVSRGTAVLTMEIADSSATAATPATPVPPTPDPAAPAPATPPAAAPTSPPLSRSSSSGAANSGTAASSVQRPDIARNGASTPHASPSVRRFARELGVDLLQTEGSGPHGRILLEDVQRYVKATLAGGPPAGGSGLSVLAWPRVDFAKFGEIEVAALSRIRKISGPNLHRNWVTIPHVTQFDEADITELEAFRKTAGTSPAAQSVKITLLAFLCKASVAALQAFPDFNASLDGDNLVLKHYYHLGFAADTPNGLVVPVIRDVDRKGVIAIATELATLSSAARDGKLKPAEMQGGSFTISSLGGIGGTAFTPIINAPEVAILGVSRAAVRPVYKDGLLGPRLMLPLSLSYDHRVIDGAAAARFTVYLAETLADIRRLVL